MLLNKLRSSPGLARSQRPAWQIWSCRAFTEPSDSTPSPSIWRVWRQRCQCKDIRPENSNNSSSNSTPVDPHHLIRARGRLRFISCVSAQMANSFSPGRRALVRRTSRFANTKRLDSPEYHESTGWFVTNRDKLCDSVILATENVRKDALRSADRHDRGWGLHWNIANDIKRIY